MEGMLEQLLDDFLKEAQEDHVGLWAVLWVLKSKFPGNSPNELQSKTISLIERMLERGAVAGMFVAKSFQPWNDQNPRSVGARIRREWRELGREPDIGDIVWLTCVS